MLRPGCAKPDHWVIWQVPLMIVPIPGACLVPRRSSGSPGKLHVVEFLPKGCSSRLCGPCQTGLYFTHCSGALSREPPEPQKVLLETNAKIKETTNSESKSQPRVRIEDSSAAPAVMASVYLVMMPYQPFDPYPPKYTTLLLCTFFKSMC